MRILIAGASGALGKCLVPRLAEAGHEVIGTTRSTAKAGALNRLGAQALTLDALDRVAVRKAVGDVKPEVVVHQLTAIADKADFANIDRSFAATNELRTKGLDYLLDAAIAAGAGRFVAQSFTGWPNPRTGGMVKTEDDPLDDQPAVKARQTLSGIRHVERAMLEATAIEGVALRYGLFYGPGTALRPHGEIANTIRGRKLPIVGNGQGLWSFVHIDDAAAATHLAIESEATGVFNVVDDEPAPATEWLPYLAKVLGAKPPMRVPVWLARPLAGEFVINAMTANRGSSNAKAKRILGWRPQYPSWRNGFADLA